MSDKLRWGLIGCGSVVKRKSGPSIMGTRRSEIVAVMRRDREKGESYARENGIGVFTQDASEVIGRADADIIYVATPPSSHREYVLQAAAAGKHVLVEKPMGMNEAESLEMVKACESAGVELFVAYYRRFHPHVLKMKELIREGALGRVVLGFVHLAGDFSGVGRDGWTLKPEISGGGHFVDVVSHRIDLLVDLLGDVEDVCGAVVPSDRPGIENAASAALAFKSGALGSVNGDFTSSRNLDAFRLIGTKGDITTDRLDGHSLTFSSGGKDSLFSFEPLKAPHLGLIRHIEDVLAGRDENRSPGRDGAITDRILDRSVRRRAAGCASEGRKASRRRGA